jgi:predicted nucleic acid-binding protein
MAHGLVVVTRNVKDMERCNVRVCNPWRLLDTVIFDSNM